MSERWYEDKQMLQQAYDEYGSFAAISDNVGGADRTTLSRWWHKHKLGSIRRGPSPNVPVNQEALARLAKSVYGKQSN